MHKSALSSLRAKRGNLIIGAIIVLFFASAIGGAASAKTIARNKTLFAINF